MGPHLERPAHRAQVRRCTGGAVFAGAVGFGDRCLNCSSEFLRVRLSIIGAPVSPRPSLSTNRRYCTGRRLRCWVDPEASTEDSRPDHGRLPLRRRSFANMSSRFAETRPRSPMLFDIIHGTPCSSPGAGSRMNSRNMRRHTSSASSQTRSLTFALVNRNHAIELRIDASVSFQRIECTRGRAQRLPADADCGLLNGAAFVPPAQHHPASRHRTPWLFPGCRQHAGGVKRCRRPPPLWIIGQPSAVSLRTRQLRQIAWPSFTNCRSATP